VFVHVKYTHGLIGGNFSVTSALLKKGGNLCEHVYLLVTTVG